MWGNFDLGRLGEQLSAVAGEALQKATADVEKNIDNRLGIQGGPGAKAVPEQVQSSVETKVSAATGRGDVAVPSDRAGTSDPAAPKPVQKKVVKKIIRRVVKGSGEASQALTVTAGSAGAVAAGGSAGPDGNDAANEGRSAGSVLPPQPSTSTDRIAPSSADTPTTAAEPVARTDADVTFLLPSDAASAAAAVASLSDQQAHGALDHVGSSAEGRAAPRRLSANGTSAAELHPQPHAEEGGAVPAPTPVGDEFGAQQHPEHHCHQRGDGEGESSAPAPSQPPNELGLDGERQGHQTDGYAAAAPAATAGDPDAAAPNPAASSKRHKSPTGGDGWGEWPEDDADTAAVAAEAAAAASAGALPEPREAEEGAAVLPSETPPVVSAHPAASSPPVEPEASSSPSSGPTEGPHVRTTESPEATGPSGTGAAAGARVSPADAAADASTGPGSGRSSAGRAGTAAAAAAPLPEPAADSKPAKLVEERKAKPAKAEPPTAPANGPIVATVAAAAAVKGGPPSRRASGGEGAGVGGGSPEEEDLRRVVSQLRSQLGERDAQLQVQALQVADLQQVVTSLQSRNEQLALKSAQLSEADFEAVRAEFEQRLATTERKVYALTKERDALRKGSEKMSEYGALIKEKDEIIKQVMEEGEKLSKKQVDLESIIKRLRAQLAATEGEREKLVARVAAEEGAVAELRKAKAKLERELVAAGEQSKGDLESQKEHFEMLLQKAKSDQVDAEERARDAVAQGLARKLRESEARCEALAESCAELRDALDRQRQAADLREEMLKADLTDLERRCQATELRHQDLASKMPEATRPLLRQIEGMQAAMEAQSEAWRGAEAALQARITDAETRAATAAERERLAVDKMQILSTKASSLEASLAASRTEVRSLNDQLESAGAAGAAAREAAAEAARQAEGLAERCRLLERQVEQLDASLRESRDHERSARSAAEADMVGLRREYERRLVEAEGELTRLRAEVQADAMRRAPEPPTMAAPGYRWMLVKEGEQPPGLFHQTEAEAQSSGSDGPRPSSSADLLASSLRGPGTGAASHPRGFSSSTGGVGGGGGGAASGPGDGVHAVMASELESLRAALRAKTGELQAAHQHVTELEATRDRLAEELVAGATRAEAASEALQLRERLEAEVADLKTKLNKALELVGERDEQVEELLADLTDVKSMYKDQIQFMCQQLLEMQHSNSNCKTSHHIQPGAGAGGAAAGGPAELAGGTAHAHLSVLAGGQGQGLVPGLPGAGGHGHGAVGVHGLGHGHAHGHGYGLPPHAGVPGKPMEQGGLGEGAGGMGGGLGLEVGREVRAGRRPSHDTSVGAGQNGGGLL